MFSRKRVWYALQFFCSAKALTPHHRSPLLSPSLIRSRPKQSRLRRDLRPWRLHLHDASFPSAQNTRSLTPRSPQTCLHPPHASPPAPAPPHPTTAQCLTLHQSLTMAYSLPSHRRLRQYLPRHLPRLHPILPSLLLCVAPCPAAIIFIAGSSNGYHSEVCLDFRNCTLFYCSQYSLCRTRISC